MKFDGTLSFVRKRTLNVEIRTECLWFLMFKNLKISVLVFLAKLLILNRSRRIYHFFHLD
ncbi:hypothetical protein DDZ16_20085 [Marinilabilia rubra]|uniref:Uncharacterized protein n=1 Tax=Marinilabilia rubra TaxID=2162893 RepID=A0A2U2B3E5_9BACT|nr:hypothetical protein DDZ16_20085 [Marinilabilia rubra]